MNTLQNVYDRLSDKTELAKHEVELSIIEDIKKSYAPLGSKFLSLESDLYETKNKMITLKKEFEQLLPKIATALKMAVDLGAMEVVTAFKEYEKSTNEKIKNINAIIAKI
jgi:hypothetical protein